MRINQLKAGVILTYLSQAIHVLSSMLYTPIMLRLLGQSEYGLYQLVSSVVSYLGLLNLGFGAGYIRFYSKYKAENDEKSIKKLNGMYLIVFAVLGLISLVCGGAMLLNAKAIFGSGLSLEELSKAKVLMLMMIISLPISLLDSVFSCYLTAKERFLFQKALACIKGVLSPFVTLPLLIMGYGSVGMVAVSLVITMASFLTHVWFATKKLDMRFDFWGFDFSLLKQIWVFTFFIFINMIIDQINWSVDKFLLGRMIGTTAVAVYGIAASLNSMYLTFSAAISSVFVPKVNMLVSKENDNQKLTNLFTKVGRIQFIILALIISGYILYGKEFIAFWAGEAYKDAYLIGLLLMLPVTIPLIQNLGIEIQRAKNMHKIRSVVYFVMAIANIFLSIQLIKYFGVVGAAVGTAVSLVLGNGIFMNVYYHKKMGLDILHFWKQILKFLPAVALTVVVGVIIKMFIPAKNIVLLGVDIVIYCLVYLTFMWIMGMNKSEKDLFRDPLKKILDRKSR